MKFRTDAEREAAFHAKCEVEPTSGCWLWLGGVNDQGYGTFFDGHTRRAHRWAYERFVGAIPAGLQLDHLCSVRLCVNPAHLEPVSALENIRRSWARGREPTRGRTPRPCPHGESFKSYCRECEHERGRLWRQDRHWVRVDGRRVRVKKGAA